MKRIVSLVTIIVVTSLLFADGVFTISNSDLKLFNTQGKQMELTEDVASNVSKGWIIRTSDKPVIVTTPIGSVKLEANSLLVTGNLDMDLPSLYLVDGEASFSTDNDFTGLLTVSTPVSSYILSGDSQVYLATSSDEECLVVFKGNAKATNILSGRQFIVPALNKLDMQVSSIAKLSEDDLQKYEIYSLDGIHPLISLVPVQEIEQPKQLTVEVKPLETEETIVKKVSIPNQIQSVTVTSVPVVPEEPNSVFVSDIKKETNIMFVISVTPMKPIAPVYKPTKITVQPLLKPAMVETPAQVKAVETSGSGVEAKKSTMVTTSVTNEAKNDIGVSLAYEFGYGISDKKMDHKVTLTPFFSSEWFSLALKANAETSDFSSFQSNVYPFDSTDIFATIGSVSRLIDKIQIGSINKWLFLAVDDNSYPTDGSALNAKRLVSYGGPNFYFHLKIGSFTMKSSFQDLYLLEMLKGKYNYGNFSLAYDAQSWNIVLGAMLRTKKVSVDLYPYLELSFPLVNNRALRLNLLINAASYLPTYPTIDFSQVFSTQCSYFFPNFNLLGGLKVSTGGFTMKVQIGGHKGQTYPMLVNDFSIAGLDMSFDSDFDVQGSISFTSSVFHAMVLYNQPLLFDGTSLHRGKLTASPSQGADLLQASIGLDIQDFSLNLGYEIYGIAETSDFFAGPYNAAIASASYRFRDFLFKLGAKHVVSANTLTGFAMVQYTYGKKF